MCIHVCVCVCDALVTQWCAVSHRKLLHLIVVGQQKESPLKNTHFLHFQHHILVDPIHYLLQTETERNDVHMNAPDITDDITEA